MDCHTFLNQAVSLRQQHQRVTYGAFMRQFQLDKDQLKTRKLLDAPRLAADVEESFLLPHHHAAIDVNRLAGNIRRIGRT